MTMFIKVCGITDSIAAEACVAAGVDAVGFVFSSSPRMVTPVQARAISSGIPGSVAKVAVFSRPSAAELDTVLEAFEPDLVQADHDTIEDLVAVPALPVYHEAPEVDPVHVRFLYEGPVSGVGRRVDFDKAAGLARRGEMILAGGLRPGNVAEAIESVRPFGVDVSSGVESVPGVKDPALIRSFVAAVRAAEERLVSA